jgi:hypothetical protein
MDPMVGLNAAIERARLEMSSDVGPRAEYDRVCAELAEARAELERLRREPPQGSPSHDGCVSCHPPEGT